MRATCSERVAYMGGAVSRFGDIAGDIGFRWTRTGTETLFIREKVLVDARAAGIRYPISGMRNHAVADMLWEAEVSDPSAAIRKRRYRRRDELRREMPDLMGDPFPAT